MKFRLVNFCLFYFIISFAYGQEFSIESLITKTNQFKANGRFLEAKKLIEDYLSSNNENWFELSKELIYINEKLGFYEENLKIFKEAHQKGYFYFIHPEMPKYKPYKEIEGFMSISLKDLQLLSEANKISKTIYEVQLPENYNKTKTYPIIFLFHGGGKNIQDVKKHWQIKELNNNYIKVYIQSHRYFGSKTYGWGSVDERLETDFNSIYKDLKEKYKIDTTAILMGSISAGANIVIETALRSIIPVKGYIVYCPALPIFLKDQKFDLINNNDVKAFIIAGETDHFLPKQKTLTKLFDSLKIDYRYTVVKNMGHQYPDCEEKYVTDGIQSIFDKNPISNDLDRYIKERIEIGYNKGVSIGIIDTTGTRFYNYGKAFNNSDATPTENTIYEIGSVSKIFTTSIYSILLDQGILSNDNTVGDFISKSKLKGSVRKIKLIDLATHTSGLPVFPANLNTDLPGNFSIGYERKDLFEFLNEFDVPKNPEYIYSNTGISLLAIVLEKATGKTYKELLENYIFKELKMGSTFIKVPDDAVASFADGSSLCVEKDHWDLSSVFTPVGGIKSSVVDLTRFIKANLQLLEYKYAESFESTIDVKKKISENNFSGIGWKIMERNGMQIVYHSGNTGGFSGFIGFCNDQKKGVVVLANSNISVDPIGRKLLDQNYELKELKNHICFKLSKIIQEQNLDSALHFYSSEIKNDKSDYILGELQLAELANAYITKDKNISGQIYEFALKNYPESIDLTIAAVNYYKLTNKSDKAKALLSIIQKQYPENEIILNMIKQLEN